MTPTMPRRARSERGSGTLLTLFAGLLLATALAMAVLWSTISIARHKLTAAADLAALSAAHTLDTAPSADPAADPTAGPADTDPTADPVGADSSDPCATAARIAALHHAALAACEVHSDSVSVHLTTQLHIADLARPTLTATARAGPL